MNERQTIPIIARLTPPLMLVGLIALAIKLLFFGKDKEKKPEAVPVDAGADISVKPAAAPVPAIVAIPKIVAQAPTPTPIKRQVAEISGDDWPQRPAVAFARSISREDADAQGLGVMLLADIRRIFAESRTEKMFSRILVETLCGMSNRQWPEAHRGKPITENWLARRLHTFGIGSRTLRIDDQRAKGYELADFTEAFERYLSAGNNRGVTT